jgi:beta-carotene ketolase (CrtW type)
MVDLQSGDQGPQQYDRASIVIVIALIGSWSSTLSLLLNVSVSQVSFIWLILMILGRTFLHTGLFILAHDAMHDNLIPRHPSLNHRIGQLCVGLYAFLSYQQCQLNHRKHHQMPAQVGDPDFHDGIHTQPLWWYLKFLRGYLSLQRFSIFTLAWGSIFLALSSVCHVAIVNIVLFWVLPLILSSMQLFIFGTYLPHRQPLLHHAVETTPPTSHLLWSLLSCYHFGTYHSEHHVNPQIPWYQLHRAKQPNLGPQSTT